MYVYIDICMCVCHVKLSCLMSQSSEVSEVFHVLFHHVLSAPVDGYVVLCSRRWTGRTLRGGRIKFLADAMDSHGVFDG